MGFNLGKIFKPIVASAKAAFNAPKTLLGGGNFFSNLDKIRRGTDPNMSLKEIQSPFAKIGKMTKGGIMPKTPTAAAAPAAQRMAQPEQSPYLTAMNRVRRQGGGTILGGGFGSLPQLQGKTLLGQ